MSARHGVCVFSPAPLLAVTVDTTPRDATSCTFTRAGRASGRRRPLRRLAADLRRMGVFVVADLSGGNLRAALEGGVDLLKVSAGELVRDGIAEADDPAAISAAIAVLQASGARDVVVSRAGEPAIASSGDTRFLVSALRLEVVEPMGSGDSMTAGLALAAVHDLSPEDALRLATAAGGLSVARHEVAAGDAEAIRTLAAKVEVHPAG